MDKNHLDKVSHKLVTSEDKIWLPPSYTNNKPPTFPGSKKRSINWGFTNKSFWEWILLLGTLLAALGAIVIPFVVTIVGLTYTQQQAQLSIAASERQHQTDLQIAQDQQQAAILQTYIDNIQDLLLNHNLLKSKPSEDIAILARARTLTALQGLDRERKARLLIFLHEANLIGFRDTNFKIHDPVILLSNADLSNANLSNADLSGTNLSGTNLSFAQLSHATLSGADLTDATLSGATLSNATLSNVTLSNATLSNATLTGADLTDTNLSGANLNSAQLSGATLTDANLRHANLYGADLDYADLRRAILTDATLNRANLERANLNDANLSNVTLNGANLSNVTLNGADLTDATLSGANLSGAILIGANGLTQQQLNEAYTCKDAFLPELTCHHSNEP